MGAGRHERQLVKIRRRGRHTAPSQVEKVAEKAGKAAPAMAIAGALVAAPQAQHALAKPATVAAAHINQPAVTRGQASLATLESVVTRDDAAAAQTADAPRSTATRVVTTAARKAASTYYTVQSGNTLSQIAQQHYNNAGDWPWLYHVNDATVKDPNLIYPGQRLSVPADPPGMTVVDSYIPKHAAPAPATVSTTATHSSSSGGNAGNHSDSGSGNQPTATQSAGQGNGSSGSSGSNSSGSGSSDNGGGSAIPSGTLGCSGLEQLWEDAGGNPADAFMAAEIAMAESSGNQYALSPSDDYGYWQINISHGSLATFNALGNARSAVIISEDGTDWDPWTTYTTGAYVGQC
jgi:LysM repeat protein